MKHRNKGKAKNILAWALPLVLILLTYHFTGYAGAKFSRNFYVQNDTPPPVIARADTNLIIKGNAGQRRVPGISAEKKIADTTYYPVTDTFDFKRSKDSLDGPVVYHADDSIIYDVPTGKMILYGKKASVNYSDNNLSAPIIEYDQNTQLVKASLTKDSLGRVTNYPYYSQKDFQSVSDTILFDMRSGKGLTKGTYTKQGEMFVYGEKIKKADTATFYALNARFTTCNLDTPHFAFLAHRVKFVNKKWAYSGFVHPEFEGVPVPIGLPFGIFPLQQGRHSGLLAPTFTANEQLGITLENLGYYKIISPNWDIITRGSLYSYGSWSANINPRYYRRYHYQGNIALAVQKIKPLDEKGNKTFRLDWSHTADTKSRPGVTFQASVNAGSSEFNSQVPNSPQTNFQNQLSSTIAYAKNWKNRPYNITINASHNQNTVSKLINLNLPDISFNVNTQYPFRRKEAIGDLKWYENLGIGYSGNARSLTYFYDTATNVGKQALDNLQYGAVHRIPLTLSLPPIGPVQISPSVSYEEKWYQQKFTRTYNPVKGGVDTSYKRGLYTARQMSFGLSLATRIFGMYGFKASSNVRQIRHEIRPSVTINYSPNFNANNYYYTAVDSSGRQLQYSYYDASIFGPYSNQRFGGLSFSIDNNIQMKKRDRNDTSAKAERKISILDGLRLDGSYNFLADSFRLSPLALSARTTINEKINISADATFNPYQLDGSGNPVDKLVWAKNPFSLGHLVGGSIRMESQFRGGEKKSSPNTAIDPLQNAANAGLAMDEYQREAAYIQSNPGEFADFEIPYQADFSYSLIFNRVKDLQTNVFSTIFTQGTVFNASANLSQKWKVGVNGNYNISLKQLQSLSMYLSRDMHCWQMSINVSPIGIYRFFSINISPKSAILRDLKINRTRSFYDF